MSSIRLLIDEDAMDRRFLNALRVRGVDVASAGEMGTTGYSDEEQLLIATQEKRVFYTFNVSDFCQLHSDYITQQKIHWGIIISSQDYSVGEQMRRTLKLIATQFVEAMRNQLVFLSSFKQE